MPRKEKEKSAVLEQRMHENSTLIIYESPHRVTDTLKTIAKIDATRQVSLGRELTKKFEQIVTDDVTQLQALIQQGDVPLKGEFVILIEGAKANNEISWFDDLSINEHVDHYIQTSQMKPKQAIKKVAEERQLKTNEVYNIYHQIS